jgi:hypothetical protein
MSYFYCLDSKPLRTTPFLFPYLKLYYELSSPIHDLWGEKN